MKMRENHGLELLGCCCWWTGYKLGGVFIYCRIFENLGLLNTGKLLF